MSSLWRFLGLVSASSCRVEPFGFFFDIDLYTDAMALANDGRCDLSLNG